MLLDELVHDGLIEHNDKALNGEIFFKWKLAEKCAAIMQMKL